MQPLLLLRAEECMSNKAELHICRTLINIALLQHTTHQSIHALVQQSEHQILNTRQSFDGGKCISHHIGSVYCCLGNTRSRGPHLAAIINHPYWEQICVIHSCVCAYRQRGRVAKTKGTKSKEKLLITASARVVKRTSLWLKAVNPLSADLWTRGSGMWAKMIPLRSHSSTRRAWRGTVNQAMWKIAATG